jgi:hypothetical protein
MPRPNLSAIERGKREVTLATIRSLGAALEVRPGLLVDGASPDAPSAAQAGRPSLSRATVERMADAVAFGRRVADPSEQRAVAALRLLFGHRTAMIRHRARPRTSRQAVLVAWETVTSRYGRGALQMFADRVAERQRAART